jgi:hypothetical protein
MFRLRTGISFIAVFVLTATVQAAPISFSLQDGTFGSGATMSGTVVIDTATGSLVSTDLIYTLGGSSVTFDRTFFAQGTIPALYNVYFPLTYGGVVDGPQNPLANPPAVDEYDLLLPTSSLVGYTGGSICTFLSDYCGGGIASEYFGRINFPGNDGMATGSLVPLTATPEPSEFALTLTGAALCAFIGLGQFRRRQTETTSPSSYS